MMPNAKTAQITELEPTIGAPKTVLRRTGKKTLRFAGSCLAEATGYQRAATHWYEIGLYQRDVGGVVAAIRHFHKSEQQRDRFIAERFETVEAAAAFLETYQPSIELSVGFDPASPALSAAEVTILAAGLRARQAEYCHSYDAVCGDVLHAASAHLSGHQGGAWKVA